MNLLFYILFLFEFCGARLCAQERYLAKQNKALTRAVDKLKAQNEKLQLKEEEYRNAKRENAILERKLEDALKTPAPVEQDEGRIEELLKENEELRIERDQLKSEKGRFCNEYFGEINELNEKLEECSEENGGLKSQNEKATGELEICSKKKEELSQQKKALRVERDELKAEKRRTRIEHLGEINELNAENGQIKEENEELKRQLDALETSSFQQKTELQVERDALKAEKRKTRNEHLDEINELNAENGKLKEENEELKRQLDALEELNEKLEENNEENGGLKSQNEKATQELEICAKKKEELFQQKRELRVERDELKAEKRRTRIEHLGEINELNAENGKLKEENEELKRQLDALEASSFQQKRELQVERDALKAEKRKTRNEHLGEINELNAENVKLEEENEELKRQLDAMKASSTEIAPIKTSDAILVIPGSKDGGVAASYLMKKDGSTQIPAQINAATNDFAQYATYALVKGQLFIFGGESNEKKIAKLEGCRFEELSARLNENRDKYSAAISINGGSSALICFGWDDSKHSCEKFDGRSALPTFSATWTHNFGGLGIYQKQPATVGSYSYPEHGKAETLSSTGWSALPDFPFAISGHSLVGLENESLLLLGGWDVSLEEQTGIWNLKNGRWRRIGELAKPGYGGSAVYSGRSIFYFDSYPIHRIDLDNKEELEKVEIIGNQPHTYYYPILLETSSDFCV